MKNRKFDSLKMENLIRERDRMEKAYNYILGKRYALLTPRKSKDFYVAIQYLVINRIKEINLRLEERGRKK